MIFLPAAVSHEYAQLQKQLAAAQEEQELSATLVMRLTSDAADSLSPAVPEQPPGAQRAALLGHRRSSQSDDLRTSQVRTSYPDNYQLCQDARRWDRVNAVPSVLFA